MGAFLPVVPGGDLDGEGVKFDGLGEGFGVGFAEVVWDDGEGGLPAFFVIVLKAREGDGDAERF